MVLLVLVIRTVQQVRRVSEGRWVVSSLQTACAPKDQSRDPTFAGPSSFRVVFSVAKLSYLRLHSVRNLLPVGSWRMEARQAGEMRPDEARLSDV